MYSSKGPWVFYVQKNIDSGKTFVEIQVCKKPSQTQLYKALLVLVNCDVVYSAGYQHLDKWSNEQKLLSNV